MTKIYIDVLRHKDQGTSMMFPIANSDDGGGETSDYPIPDPRPRP
jgi:hypothetical protein